MVDLIEYESLGEFIKVSQRKLLMAFIKEHLNDETKMIAVPKLPRSKNEDFGTLCFLMISRNLYNPQIEDYFVLVDTMATDKIKENFQSFYSRKEKIIEFLGYNNIRIGRPRKVLSDEEKAKIIELRSKRLGINKIAKELRINNRLVMEFCRELSSL